MTTAMKGAPKVSERNKLELIKMSYKLKQFESPYKAGEKKLTNS